MKFKFTGGVFLLVLALLTYSCKVESANDSTTTYTITVDPKGGTGVNNTYQADEGKPVNIPSPTKPNNRFIGWSYTDGGPSIDFISNQTTISENKTIYALWEQLTFKVTVDANGGVLGKFTDTTVDNGKTVPQPLVSTLPTKLDSELVYWSTEKNNYATHFEFDSSPVKSDITLYPHFRLTASKLNSHLNGNWVSTVTKKENIVVTTSNTLFRIDTSAINKMAYCTYSDQRQQVYDPNLLDPKDISYLNELKAIPIFDFSYTANGPIPGNTSYTVTLKGNNNFNISNLVTIDDIYQCTYGDYKKFQLNNDYFSKESDVIGLAYFERYNAFDTGYTIKLTSYTLNASNQISEFTIEVTKGNQIVDFKLVKVD